MKKNYFLTTLFILGIPIFLWSQNKPADQYKQESKGIKNMIWSHQAPIFQTRAIPDSLRKLSKVIIAHQTELYVETNTGYLAEGISNRKRDKSPIVEIVREMVLLNDLKAIEDYSEITYDEIAEISGFVNVGFEKRYIGIRVIKSSGTISEVETEDMILDIAKKEAKLNKLAVPDLQKGDVIEFFVFNQQPIYLNNDYELNYQVHLYRSAPVLRFSLVGKLSSNYALEYRCFNCLNDLKVSKDEEEGIEFKYDQVNIPAYERNLFVNSIRSLPIIKLNIGEGVSERDSKKYGYNKKGEVYKNRSYTDILNDLSKQHSTYYAKNPYSSGGILRVYPLRQAKIYAEEVGLDFKTMKGEEKAAWMYYSQRFEDYLDVSRFNCSQRIQMLVDPFLTNRMLKFSWGDPNLALYCFLNGLDLNPVIIVGSNKKGNRLKEVMHYRDLEQVIYLPELNRFMYMNTIFDPPFKINNLLERESENYLLKVDKPGFRLGADIRTDLGALSPGKPLPAASFEENEHRETLHLTLTGNDSKLKCMRLTRLTGQFKFPIQRKLIVFEDIYESERKAMGFKNSLIEASMENKFEKITRAELNNILQAQRVEQEKAFYEEAKEQFGLEVSQLKNFRIDSLGVRHTNPDMIYSSEFELDGIVKKAGINLILDIGKIQGPILEIEGDQRNRTLDIYRDYPYQVNYSIEVEIPVGMGYRCDDVAALNTKVENQCGRFSTTARIVGTKIQITIQKVFYRDFEPVDNWPLLLEIIDASSKWKSARILFKK